MEVSKLNSIHQLKGPDTTSRPDALSVRRDLGAREVSPMSSASYNVTDASVSSGQASNVWVIAMSTGRVYWTDPYSVLPFSVNVDTSRTRAPASWSSSATSSFDLNHFAAIAQHGKPHGATSTDM